MKKSLLILLILAGLGLVALAGWLEVGLALAAPSGANTTIQSINKAKRALLHQVYYDHMITFYCGCKFDQSKSITDRNGYRPSREWKRAKRVEWEHVVPAQAFGRSFPEWRDGHSDCKDSQGEDFRGRRCASKASLLYRYMQSDMYNLVPAVGEINALRSNYSFAMVMGEPRKFGDCDMEIENRKAEPPEHIRGDIARIYFYMDWAYPGRGIISKKNRKLFEVWDKVDPVDGWERERARRIRKVQGNENPFVR